jgi:hypothetical protein
MAVVLILSFVLAKELTRPCSHFIPMGAVSRRQKSPDLPGFYIQHDSIVKYLLNLSKKDISTFLFNK